MDNSAFWIFMIVGIIGLITGIHCWRGRAKQNELDFYGYLATAFGAYLLTPASLIILLVGIFCT